MPAAARWLVCRPWALPSSPPRRRRGAPSWRARRWSWAAWSRWRRRRGRARWCWWPPWSGGEEAGENSWWIPRRRGQPPPRRPSARFAGAPTKHQDAQTSSLPGGHLRCKTHLEGHRERAVEEGLVHLQHEAGAALVQDRHAGVGVGQAGRGAQLGVALVAQGRQVDLDAVPVGRAGRRRRAHSKRRSAVCITRGEGT